MFVKIKSIFLDKIRSSNWLDEVSANHAIDKVIFVYYIRLDM